MKEYEKLQIVYDMFIESCSMRRRNKKKCKQEKPTGKKKRGEGIKHGYRRTAF